MVIITLMRTTGRRLAPERTLLIYLFDFTFSDGRVKLCCPCPAKCLMEKGGTLCDESVTWSIPGSPESCTRPNAETLGDL
jgi:hypothetical protein